MDLPIGNVYQQSQRDERSTQWGPYNYRVAVATGATTIVVGDPADASGWRPPPGYIAHIRSAAILITPGTDQFITGADLWLKDSADNIIGAPWQIENNLADNVSIEETVALDILVLPRQFISLRGQFDADVEDNTVRLSIQAILLTQGNVAVF